MIKVLISSDTRYPVNRRTIRKAVFDQLAKNKISSDVELSVSIVGERKMQNLVKKYMGEGHLHDVLSFPFLVLFEKGEIFINYPDKILRLGDIVLCWPQVLISAARDDKLVDDEVYFLTCHAVDHLLGEHHE